MLIKITGTGRRQTPPISSHSARLDDTQEERREGLPKDGIPVRGRLRCYR